MISSLIIKIKFIQYNKNKEVFKNDTIFWANYSLFDQNNRFVSMSLFVGKRTLDIYLLHYFFLPDLMCFREWLIPNERMLMQLVAAGIVSCLVICICLLVSEILRTSNFLGHYLFGAKRV